MPRAASSDSAPVGMTATSSSGAPEPSRMTAPLPNCRSICAIARSRACRRSLLTSAMRVSLKCLSSILGVARGWRQCLGTETGRRSGYRCDARRSCLFATIFDRFAEPLDQVAIGAALEDLVELAPVVGDEADPLDREIVGQPAVAPTQHPVLHRDLAALPGHDTGADDRQLAVHRLAGEGDPLAVVELDLGDVGALEEVTEEPDDLPALGRRARLPVGPQRALGDLGEIEDVAGDLPESRPPLAGAQRAVHLGILEHAEHLVD